jgi:hypothetical protein
VGVPRTGVWGPTLRDPLDEGTVSRFQQIQQVRSGRVTVLNRADHQAEMTDDELIARMLVALIGCGSQLEELLGIEWFEAQNLVHVEVQAA